MNNISGAKPDESPPAPAQQSVVRINSGYLYISHDVYNEFLSGIKSVVLLARPKTQILILPVHHEAAGGLLLKIRNGKGDRAVAAMDFLRHHGIEDEQDLICQISWDKNNAALVAELPEGEQIHDS